MHGTGQIIKTPCQTCKGKGKVRRTRKIKVNVPAGIDEGQTLCVRGEGNAGSKGGPAGDLMVTITIRPHPVFERRGNDIFMEVPISFADACLGTELEVPTLEGKVLQKIPAGTASHTTFRLQNKGIQHLNSRGRGDQYVKVTVEVPKSLTNEQKERLTDFDRAMKGGGKPIVSEEKEGKKKFIDRLKDALD